MSSDKDPTSTAEHPSSPRARAQSTSSSLPSYHTLPSPSPPRLYIVYRTSYPRASDLKPKVSVVSAHLNRETAEMAAEVIALEDREQGDGIQIQTDNLADVGALLERTWSKSYKWGLMPAEVGVQEVVLSCGAPGGVGRGGPELGSRGDGDFVLLSVGSLGFAY